MGSKQENRFKTTTVQNKRFRCLFRRSVRRCCFFAVVVSRPGSGPSMAGATNLGLRQTRLSKTKRAKQKPGGQNRGEANRRAKMRRNKTATNELGFGPCSLTSLGLRRGEGWGERGGNCSKQQRFKTNGSVVCFAVLFAVVVCSPMLFRGPVAARAWRSQRT